MLIVVYLCIAHCFEIFRAVCLQREYIVYSKGFLCSDRVQLMYWKKERNKEELGYAA